MKHFDIAILGSGASGCMCALTAGGNDKKIALIDKNKSVAKKLMATGNGRCNLTNLNSCNLERFFNQNIDQYLSIFNFANTIKFFENLGLVIYGDEQQRVYPISNSAKSVIDVINNKLKKYENITIFNEKTIENIEKTDEIFKIRLNDEDITADKVVFALGGNNNLLLKNLGIKCKENNPSLCALKTNKTQKVLANIRVSPVIVHAKCDKSGEEYCEKGEVLFRENGLSGIVIFNASTIFARAGDYNGSISIDLLPDTPFEKIIEILKNRRNLDVKISNFFDGMFASGIAYYIFQKCKINEQRSSLDISDKEIEKLATLIKNLSFKTVASLENNQVYSGGALLSQLDNTLQSKDCNGLYICGEACNVDGICGGFNLQWAWTSGFIVGINL